MLRKYLLLLHDGVYKSPNTYHNRDRNSWIFNAFWYVLKNFLPARLVLHTNYLHINVDIALQDAF
jgi:hypothetical protein